MSGSAVGIPWCGSQVCTLAETSPCTLEMTACSRQTLGLLGSGLSHMVHRRLLCAAKSGLWCLTSHHLWPDTFKAAARALLLAAHHNRSPTSGSSGGSQRRQPWASPAQAPFTPLAAGRASQTQPSNKRAAIEHADGGSIDSRGSDPDLGALPTDLLLRILQLSALPMSAWVPL